MWRPRWRYRRGSADQHRLKVAGLHRSEFTPAHPLDLADHLPGSFRKEARSLEDISCTSPVGDGGLLLTGSIRRSKGPRLNQAGDRSRSRFGRAGRPAGSTQRPGRGRSGHGKPRRAFRLLNPEGPCAIGHWRNGGRFAELTPPSGGKPFLFAPVRVRCEAGSPALLLQPVRLAMGAPSRDGGRPVHSRRLRPPLRRRYQPDPAASLRQGGWDCSARTQRARRRGNGGTRPGRARQVVAAGAGLRTSRRLIDRGGQHLHQERRAHHVVFVPAPQDCFRPGNLSPTQVAWTNASFSYGKLEAQGTLEYPTLCTGSTLCAGHFALNSPALDLAALQSTLLGASEGGELLRQILARIDRHSVQWPDLTGTVQIGALSTGKLVVHDAIGAIDISGNLIKIRSLNGHLANGTIHLAGEVDASGSQPEYQIDLQVTNAAPSALSSIFDERWGGGLANFSAQLTMSGFDAQDLARSTTGTLRWDWTKGGLAADDPLPVAAQPFAHFDQWSADATIADSTIKITHSLLARGQEAIPLSGTISFDREIDMTGGSAAHTFTVTGTLQHPEVKASPEEVEN